MQQTGSTVIARLSAAINRHDLEEFVSCLDSGYQSEQPAHPDRAFSGREQARANWASIFASVPDLKSDLLATIQHDGVAWSEWHWHGHLADGAIFDLRGVTIFGIDNDRIAWGRLYMESTEFQGAGIDAAVQQMSQN